MLDEFTAATFEPLLGERFRVSEDDSTTLEVELIEVAESAAPHPGAQRTPFSLVFRGPAEPVLPQRIYGFESDSLGAFELFIVPLGPDEAGMQYQAVFA